ncbi:MAG: hypothetical protein JXM70_16505 [Pirellulales bacterium]|nr:hypothetical protein [Pirellulales bacterium]
MKRLLVLKLAFIIWPTAIILPTMITIVHADEPVASKRFKAQAYSPLEFERMGIIATWEKYDGVLLWGKGQTLVAMDDGCDMSVPEWKVKLPWGPKVVAGYDSVDNDDDPSPVPPGYHGTGIAFPSSLNYKGKLGVAYNNSVIQIRAVTIVHLRSDEAASLAMGLQWVIDNQKRYNITAINLSPLDDQRHRRPVATVIDEKLTKLREQGVWVSAPCGNHGYTTGISWPACASACFAIGAVKPAADIVHLDRFSNTDLTIPATATSSSNAFIVGSAMILREAIEKSCFKWRREGKTLPEAMLAIFKKTGTEVTDPATGLHFRRPNLLAAVDYVFSESKPR